MEDVASPFCRTLDPGKISKLPNSFGKMRYSYPCSFDATCIILVKKISRQRFRASRLFKKVFLIRPVLQSESKPLQRPTKKISEQVLLPHTFNSKLFVRSSFYVRPKNWTDFCDFCRNTAMRV